MKKSFLGRLIKENAGFSLAEVMVAAGMVGVLSLGVSQLMQNSAKTEKRLGQQVNMISLQAEISSALSNQLACTRTFGGVDPIVDGGGQATVISTAWQDFPDYVDSAEHIFSGVNPTVLFPGRANWGKIIREYDGTINAATGKPYGVYGDGSNTITVKDIQYRGYYTGLGQGSSDDGDYAASAAQPISGSSPAASVVPVVIRITMTRGNYAQFEAMTDEERQKSNSLRNFGSFEIVRFFKVRVRMLDGDGRVDRCITSADNQITDFCQSLGGYLDTADGQCKNIKISDTTNAIGPQGNTPGLDNDWSITSLISPTNTGGSILAENHLAVGYDWDNVPTKAVGVGKKGDILAARDIKADRHLEATESVTAGTFLNVGAPSTPAAATGDASFSQNTVTDGNALVKGGLTVGLNTQDGSRNLRVRGDDLRMENAANNQNVQFFKTGGNQQTLLVNGNNSEFSRGNTSVILNSSGTNALDITKGGGLNFRVTEDGEVHIKNSGGASNIIIGANPGNSYRPIYIKNQPRGINTYKFATGATAGEEVATKEWTRRMVFGLAYENNPGLIDSVISTMTDYLQHRKADVVIGTVCNSMRLKTGSVMATCAMNAGKCECNTSNCSSAESSIPGQPICGAIHSKGDIISDKRVIANQYMRAPAIFTNGTANPGAGNMRAKIVYATDRIAAVNRVTGPKVCHTGASGVQYCYTKFGRYACRNYGTFMIGIAYGHPICAKWGTTSGPHPVKSN